MFELGAKLLTQNSPGVTDSLSASDAQLENLGQELDIVRGQYLQLVNDYNSLSFFNLNNIYFWFLIVGLLLLLFGLLYLLAELRRGQEPEKKYKQMVPKDNIVPIKMTDGKEETRPITLSKKQKKAQLRLSNLSSLSQDIDSLNKENSAKKSSQTRAIKIKVVKLK